MTTYNELEKAETKIKQTAYQMCNCYAVCMESDDPKDWHRYYDIKREFEDCVEQLTRVQLAPAKE